jgi:NDP-sugar pyrophosphorylase family protein
VEEVNVNVHHLADAILGFYGERARVGGMAVNFSREEELMGTTGGVKRLAGRFDEAFVVIMGDALTDVDVREVVDFLRTAEPSPRSRSCALRLPRSTGSSS